MGDRRIPHEHADGALWVLSDIAADGESYLLSVQAGPDRIFCPPNPTFYVRTVVAAAGHANYLAAIARQLAQVHSDGPVVRHFVGLFRGHLDDAVELDTRRPRP